MSYYDYYSKPPRDRGAADEKAWNRVKATAWDDRWHALTHRARLAYINQIKPPTRAGSVTEPSTPETGIAKSALDELVASGFVRVQAASGKKAARVIAQSESFDFATRLRAMQKYHPLGPTDRLSLLQYIRFAFYDQGEPTIRTVLQKAKVEGYFPLEEALDDYLTTRYWPIWAADAIKSPIAAKLVEAMAKSPGPVKLAAIPSLIKGQKEADVRKALDGLISQIAAFEGLDPQTLDIVAGLLPVVRAAIVEAEKPRISPPLIVCEKPADISPAAGLVANDLRVFLLEVASQPPRLRQDGGLFVKEEPRFLAGMSTWPDWLYHALEFSPEERVTETFDRAREFLFTEREDDDKAATLRLSGKGRNWLASGMEDQYATIYDSFRAIKPRSDPYYYYNDGSIGDARFLGISAVVHPQKGKSDTASAYYAYAPSKPEQVQALRETVYKAFATLKVGVFYRLDSVVKHLSFEDRNPLLLGQDPAKLVVFLDNKNVGRLPERLQAAGERLISTIILRKLLPYDALRVAVDADGFTCIARNSRFEGYFGKPYDREEEAGSGATRVIVQPDFSVIIIGINPAPAAELAPFCDRASGQVGQGALTFKITRASVIRAASQGLSASVIVARLKKHASVEVPTNVLHEVRDWAGWIRLVNVKPMTIVKCPDREAADRVASALGRRADRLSDNFVAIDSAKVTPAERLKLQEQGIIITKDDITTLRTKAEAEPIPAPTSAGPKLKKPRGRPKKIR